MLQAQKPYGIVYRIHCVPSGRDYIGQTRQTFAQRWYGHVYCAAHSPNTTVPLGRAIRKHGPQNFVHFILATADNQQELDALEIEYIHVFDSLKKGYNVKTGGTEGGFTSDWFTANRREQWRKAKLGLKYAMSETGIQSIRASHQTETARANYSRTAKRIFTDAYRKKMSDSAKARCKRLGPPKGCFANLTPERQTQIAVLGGKASSQRTNKGRFTTTA